MSNDIRISWRLAKAHPWSLREEKIKNATSRRSFLGTTAAAGAMSLAPINAARAASGDVSVWKFGGTPMEVEHWAARNAAFSAAQPDISLDYSYFNGQIRRQKILAGFETRRLADVIIAFGQEIPEFAVFELIQPLDDIAADKIDGWKERLVPEVMASGMHEGRTARTAINMHAMLIRARLWP